MSDGSRIERAWRTAGGDNSRRGCQDGSRQLKWHPQSRLKVRGVVNTSPVFDGAGNAFIADMAGWLHAFTPQGHRLWEARLDSGVSATPATHTREPRVFAATLRGTVYALDTTNGAVRWTRAIRSQSDPRILSDLLLLEKPNLVVLSSWGGKFVALEAETGAERFSWDAGVYPRSAAAADAAGNLYFVRSVEGKGLECVRVDQDGQEHLLHREPEDQRGAQRALVAAGPVLDEQRDLACFVLNQNKAALLLGLSIQSGAIRWRRPLPSTVQGVPAIPGNGVIIIADLAGAVHGFRPDGEATFRYETGCEYLLAGAVGQADGTCFVGDPWGRVHQIDGRGVGKSTFEARRSIQARPSFDPSGRLYIPCTDHTIYIG